MEGVYLQRLVKCFEPGSTMASSSPCSLGMLTPEEYKMADSVGYLARGGTAWKVRKGDLTVEGIDGPYFMTTGHNFTRLPFGDHQNPVG